jgi:hypothetical protein
LHPPPAPTAASSRPPRQARHRRAT